ncbi:hypothetical protein [Gimesia algae]|uniref:Uncharacterized protein n=1 Tax=Gimesia algae TaxID=2527971 RepID=A0A517VJ51_9PLAN|nr:hypothetical protein [Gimesia algae]QDT93017.1 hypothetical protein Pan161_46890 [Gimesia algae]
MTSEAFTFREPVSFDVSLTGHHKSLKSAEKKKYVFFQESTHTSPSGRPGFVILAGASMNFEPITIQESTVGLITYGAGLQKISSDGLILSLIFIEDQTQETHLVFQDRILAFEQNDQWREHKYDLSALAGKSGHFEISCSPGPQNDPTADWLAVYEFVISPAAEFNLNRARSFQQIRERNELAHFSIVYSHSMYQDDEGATPLYKIPARFVSLMRRGIGKLSRKLASK